MTPLKTADSMFSKRIRERDGRCIVAGWFPAIKCNGYLQCSHLVSRRYRAIRWRDYNAVTSCMAHHVYTTHHPLEWEEAVSTYMDPHNWNHLKRIALTGDPEKPAEAIARMKAPEGTQEGGGRVRDPSGPEAGDPSNADTPSSGDGEVSSPAPRDYEPGGLYPDAETAIDRTENPAPEGTQEPYKRLVHPMDEGLLTPEGALREENPV